MAIVTLNQKSTPDCFCDIVNKTQPILIKFCTYSPEYLPQIIHQHYLVKPKIRFFGENSNDGKGKLNKLLPCELC